MEYIIIPVVILFALGAGYLNYMINEGKKWAWEQFALVHKLTFVPGKLFGVRTYVVGRFRGHEIKLDSFSKNEHKKNVMFTRFSLVAHPQSKKVDLDARWPLGKPLSIGEVIGALTTTHQTSDQTKLKVAAYGRCFTLEQRELITILAHLERQFTFLSELANNYPHVLALGGQAMQSLQTLAADQVDILQPVAEQLLLDIGEETTHRLASQMDKRVCPHCLTLCTAHKASRSWWRSVTYYGCRTCRQSRTFLRGQPIAVLDEAMTQDRVEKQGVVLINWLNHRQIFDFVGVYIGQTNDEAVERFCVQVGNDMDEWRKARYIHVRCLVSPHAPLSENTRRILHRTFQNVTITKLQTV